MGLNATVGDVTITDSPGLYGLNKVMLYPILCSISGPLSRVTTPPPNGISSSMKFFTWKPSSGIVFLTSVTDLGGQLSQSGSSQDILRNFINYKMQLNKYFNKREPIITGRAT